MFRISVVLGHLGKLAIILGVSMATSIFWALYYGEDPVPHITAAAISCIAGAVIYYCFRSKESLNPKEGFALVALGWILASLLGTLPYFFSGTFSTFADAFFETVSGFTTTGASVLKDVEIIPYSVLWWRSLTHWLGGMGIMMLFVAIIADIGGRANQIFHAELPGPLNDKVSPKVGDSARMLWLTYVGLSFLSVIFLVLGGMPVFDSLCHTFGTLATGGFSVKNASLGYYNSYCQWVTIIFMFLAGANFALHYLAWETKSLKGYIKNREFMFYTFIVLMAALLILINLQPVSAWNEEWIRKSLFQVVTIITTTGYATTDFNTWP
ncbi:MAG: TrkH family potassium uptake protein, partial [Methylocystaceae bacterium]